MVRPLRGTADASTGEVKEGHAGIMGCTGHGDGRPLQQPVSAGGGRAAMSTCRNDRLATPTSRATERQRPERTDGR